MNTRLSSLFLLLMLGLLANSVMAEIRYISDVLYVPLRSGQGDDYRILHRGLPSSTEVIVIEENILFSYRNRA